MNEYKGIISAIVRRKEMNKTTGFLRGFESIKPPFQKYFLGGLQNMKKIITAILALAIGFAVGVCATIYNAQPEDDVTTLYFDGLFCVKYEGV